MANFDPYHQWLGIPPAEQPPDHYRLLGILQFEDDPTVIENAADRQMAHLKTFQTGPRSADSQRLLNEVAAARVCLLSPDKKEAYDQQLRQVSPQDDAAEPEIILDTTLPSSRKSRGNSLLIAAGLGAVTLVVVVLAAIFFTADENKPELPGNDKSLAVAEPLATEPAATEPTAINPAATSESKQPGEPLDISSLPPGAVFTDKPDADQPSSDTRDDDTKSDSVQKPPAAREDLSKMATDWGDSDKDDLAKDKSDPESPKPQPSELESQDDELTDPAAPGSMMDS
ncbi:MAG: hypothetical protein U9N87_06220, partial [Planctomycetota bacterium]|nr:hypothetical protein [Planctomycetota bacterium]